MLACARAFLVALFALAPIQAISGPVDDADAFFARWKAAYDANDNVSVAKLYATDASLHGTRSRDLTVGREAITKLFHGSGQHREQSRISRSKVGGG